MIIFDEYDIGYVSALLELTQKEVEYIDNDYHALNGLVKYLNNKFVKEKENDKYIKETSSES